MCFLGLYLVNLHEFLFHKLVQPPLVGISYSQPHILQKVVSGIYCPLCQEQTLFVSLELGLNLLMYLREGGGCVGVKRVSTSLCHRLRNINQSTCNVKSQSTFSFPDCRVLVYMVILNGRHILSLITVFLWFFSSSFISPIAFLTGIRTALVFKTWGKLGCTERQNNSLFYSLLFFLSNPKIWFAFTLLLSI